MSQERYAWILAYKFDDEYASEALWKLAFDKFKNDLREFDVRHNNL